MKDTIEVRPDEQLDEARLAEYLRGKLPGSENSLTVRQFGGDRFADAVSYDIELR